MIQIIVGAAAFAGLGLFIAVVKAPVSVDPKGDAVVMHAGGRGERLRTALELVEAGAAPTLVIMGGSAPEWPDANRWCGQIGTFEVLCPDPVPGTTLGEARTLANLADERAWASVVVVTSDYHLRRALLLDRRCSPGLRVEGVAAASDLPTHTWLARVGREMVALARLSLTRC